MVKITEMSERRSERAKKTVNYAKLGGSDDHDDDFEEFKVQPKKKPKIEPVKDKLLKPEKKNAESINPKSEFSKPRPSLEEKILQRQIKEVLEISKSVSIDKATNGKDTIPISKTDDKTKNSPEVESTEEESNSEGSSSTAASVEEENEAQETSEDTSDTLSSEEETSSSEDEQVEEKGKRKVSDLSGKETKLLTEKKNNVIVTETAKSSKNTTDVKKDENLKIFSKVENSIMPKKSEVKATVSKTITAPLRNVNKQTITNKGGIPVLHTSPLKLSPKGIRLGLSRKVRSKPLHPNVKPQV